MVQNRSPRLGDSLRAFLGAAFFLASSFAQGGSIAVPNGSFELPTDVVSVNIDSWQKSAKPDWYQETGGFYWSQLTGLFQNTATNSPDHIDNCDGSQALWLFAEPEVALFQDFDSVDWNGQSNQLSATFNVGKFYHLTAGVIGGGGGMLPGATLELSLYYRAGSNFVNVGVTTLTNTPAAFSNTTHLVDCRLDVPAVTASSPWAGHHIGIQFKSTVTADLQGGYWDLDHVRLVELAEPVLVNPALTNGQFAFRLLSEPGTTFEILATENPSLPLSSWPRVGVLTNTTGSNVFSETGLGLARCYAARQLP